ncbi:hypothetical protein ACW9UR_24705 [Halovulum sp. GXIMD14794]
MTPEDEHKTGPRLGRRADLLSDLAGYVLAAAVIGVMFALSGSLR